MKYNKIFCELCIYIFQHEPNLNAMYFIPKRMQFLRLTLTCRDLLPIGSADIFLAVVFVNTFCPLFTGGMYILCLAISVR